MDMAKDLTIVMYHYVRELEETRYPKIKGRRTSEFRKQLDALRKLHTFVEISEVVHAVATGDSLPPNPVLLTFDDGYRDHYDTVFPILYDAGIPGAFFPPVASVRRREILDVNRVHFILATATPAALAMEIDAAVDEWRLDTSFASVSELRAMWAKPNRFDDAETIYVKRMLQHVLPEELRNQLSRELFAKHVSEDEAAFAGELYATVEQFRVMQASGMYVGSHGDAHYWMDRIDRDVQEREVVSSLEFLREIGSPVDDFWVMCYPYGAHDQSLLELLRRHGCSLGLTTRVATAKVGVDDPLLFPRWDTNDIEFH